MLTKNKRLAYTVILAGLVFAFIATDDPKLLLRTICAEEAYYYRGEYTITTYYPAPFGRYQDLIAMGNVGIGTTEPAAKLHIYDAPSPEAFVTGLIENGALNAAELALKSDSGRWDLTV